MICSSPRRRLGLAALLIGLGCACSEAAPPAKADATSAPLKAAPAAPKADAAAAPAKAKADAAAAPAKAEGRRAFGAPMAAQTERVALSALVREPARYADKTVRVEGKVSAVCQGQGCWLELNDDAGTAHVKLRGHSFFVPKDSQGKRAEVEARVFPAVEKGHCEQEAEEQTGRLAKVELEATGVELFLGVGPSRSPSRSRPSAAAATRPKGRPPARPRASARPSRPPRARSATSRSTSARCRRTASRGARRSSPSWQHTATPR